MSYSSSEIVRVLTVYKYFAQKIYLLAPDEVWKTSNFNFMPKHLKPINFRVDKILQKLQN